MNHNPLIMPVAPGPMDDRNPKDKMNDLEKEKVGVEDKFDKESATFMDNNE